MAVLRTHGGVIIANEVQCGFGWIGSHFWGQLRDGFHKPAEKHLVIGDVRESGLANGLKLVLDRTTMARPPNWRPITSLICTRTGA